MSITGTFNSLTNLQKYLVVAIVALVLYAITAGASYSVFGALLQKSSGGLASSVLPGPANTVDENPNEPKTEVCPLNGSMHTKAAQASWSKRRPLSVMIENHEDARPQSGLSSADIVYEAVAEGGITRFMATFYCNLGDVQVGPVRSARTYFLDFQGEYNSLYAHVGGANTPGPANALQQIITYGVKDLNQFNIGFPTYWRDYQRLGHEVATEHTMYSTTQKLWDIGAKRSWTNVDEDGIAWDKNFVVWKFKDDSPNKGTTVDIRVPFWQNQPSYDVEWKYDSSCNCYKRINGGSPHIDFDNKQQLSPKNVIIQFEDESHANDGYENNQHLLYRTTGSGKALIFQDGKVTVGKWMKLSRVARTKYVDSTGSEIQFNRGQIWIQTLPTGNDVKY